MKKWLFVLMMLLATVGNAGTFYWWQDFNRCDTFMFIVSFNGNSDTTTLTDTVYFDTTLTGLDTTGTYYIRTRYLYQDEAEWVSVTDMLYNTYGGGFVLSAPVSTPTDSFLCRMYGYVRTIDQVAVEGARVTATFGKQNLIDTCNHVIITPKATTKTTDSVGYFFLDITKSKCIKSSDQKVSITISFPGGSTTSTGKYTVPDSASCWFIGKD
jgi:hypothetical protein